MNAQRSQELPFTICIDSITTSEVSPPHSICRKDFSMAYHLFALPSLFFHLLLLLFSYSSALSQAKTLSNLSSPYLFPSTFPPNHHHMLQNFKIFVYDTSPNPTFSNPIETLFHSSLLKSPLLTSDPDLAHLFYLSLPSDLSSRSIARSIRDLRLKFPFWNRTLGADHFYVSCTGIGIESDRNLVELKKNSIQISCFPTIEGRFIPHKDVTLPPLSRNVEESKNAERFLGFFYGKEGGGISKVLDGLRRDPEFLIESQPLDDGDVAEKISRSRFCLFFYGLGREMKVGEALRGGCVPVVISDSPILDLPFGDVLRWTEIAVFVGMGGGGEELKRVLRRTCGERYDRMRELGKKASVHFEWDWDGSMTKRYGYGYDAFHTVLYQLWIRRHTIRYSRRGEWVSSAHVRV